MFFINPLFLIGLGGLAIPVILHLLLRDRPKRLVLPTLRFLPATAPESYAMHRVKNIILLMLRMLILILIVLAFARPYIRTSKAITPSGTAAEAVVFAVDQSLSMRAGDRWDTAVSRVQTLGRASATDTHFALMFFDKKPEIACGDTDDFSRVQTALKGKSAGYGSTDLLAAIRAAGEFADKMKAHKKKVYLVSDFQDTGFHQLAFDLSLPKGVELIPIRAEGKISHNVAIVNASECPCADEGQRSVRITAEAYAGSNVPARIRLLNGRNILGEKNITLSENERSVTVFNIRLPLANEYILTAEIIAADALKEDNRVHFFLKAQRPIPVAVFADVEEGIPNQAAEAFNHSNPYLQAAILACDPLIASRWVNPSDLSALSAAKFPVAIIHVEKGLSKAVIQDFMKYVQAGGSLILFPGKGEDSAIEEFAGERLSGWESVDPKTDKYRLVTTSSSHSPVSLLDESGRTLLGHPKAFRYLRIQENPNKNLRKLISFDNGSGFLMERKEGKGRIYILTVPLHPSASDLVLRAAFTPFLYQLISFCAAEAEEKREFKVGEVYAASNSGPGQKASLIDPRQKTTILDGKSKMLQMPGIYSVRRGVKDTSLIVRIDEKESDLRPMDQMRVKLLALKGQQNGSLGQGSRQLAGIGGSIQGDAPSPDAKMRIWWYLLAAAFILMLAETLLASRTSR